MAIVIALVLLAWIRKRYRQQCATLEPAHRTVLLACASAILPLVLVQLTGTNHNLRHLCPIVAPLAVAVGLMANVVGWSSSPALLATSGLAFLAQLLMLVAPVYCPNASVVETGLVNGRLPWRALARFDQWDWIPVREMSRAAGFEEPRISLVGNGRNMDPAHIRYVWAVEGKLNTEVTMLWRYDLGPIDWARVMASIDETDIVLTAPSYTGDDPSGRQPDNEHNAEFEHRLVGNPRFRGPVRVWMGRFQPVEVDVFVRVP